MNTGYLQVLLVVIYLMSGTIGVVLLTGWALKRFGPPKHAAPNRRPAMKRSRVRPDNTCGKSGHR